MLSSIDIFVGLIVIPFISYTPLMIFDRISSGKWFWQRVKDIDVEKMKKVIRDPENARRITESLTQNSGRAKGQTVTLKDGTYKLVEVTFEDRSVSQRRVTSCK